MDSTGDFLEQLWDDLLSRQPEVISTAFARLDPDSQKNVVTHLEHMLHDPGWQTEQRLSAEAALKALANYPGQEK